MKKLLQKWFPKYFRPSWKKCSKASCWEGRNAETRHMNILSHHFSDETAFGRIDWAKARGCNCVHLFLANKGDGEGAGYSIYGETIDVGRPNEAAVKRMERRIRYARKKGLGVVLWLISDDSTAWCHSIAAAADGYLRDLKGSGLLDYASTIVLGLELDEWATDAEVAALRAACNKHAKGIKTGTHHTSGRGKFAAHGELLFWQVNPGKSAGEIQKAVEHALSFGRPVNMFEVSRSPARELALAALDAGAFGVGNW